MSMHVNGNDIMMGLHVARIVGSIVTMLIIGLLVVWAIRPSRRVRDRREADAREGPDNDDLWRVMDRMEQRLEVLERALGDQIEPPRVRGLRENRKFAPADDGRESGRTE